MEGCNGLNMASWLAQAVLLVSFPGSLAFRSPQLRVWKKHLSSVKADVFPAARVKYLSLWVAVKHKRLSAPNSFWKLRNVLKNQ